MTVKEQKEQVYGYVSGQIDALLRNKDTSTGRAQLARLRRGVGKAPGELPELWGVFLNDIDENLLSQNGIPTHAEWAIYLALTLFALHQQGNGESVNQKDRSLGRATADLMDGQYTDEVRERVMRRFAPVVTAADMPELSHHLRSLVQLLKAKGIGLDYAKLATDLYDFQFDSSRQKVQLRWGQDFFHNNNDKGE
ncbi:MAG: type I-E CRISPR-associated protein Cse2/CasB [Oscillospiraceae bacterium]|nr:type I-E CRISPR-associated protein Cse2/CasB [Oscillospiraceae bacterium]